MTKILPLGLDAWGSTESFVHFDEGEGRLIIENRTDVEPLLDRNKASANAWDGFSCTRESREIADIPAAVIHQWLIEDNLDVFAFNRDPAVRRKVLRRLRDPDYAFLRSSSGRV